MHWFTSYMAWASSSCCRICSTSSLRGSTTSPLADSAQERPSALTFSKATACLKSSQTLCSCSGYAATCISCHAYSGDCLKSCTSCRQQHMLMQFVSAQLSARHSLNCRSHALNMAENTTAVMIALRSEGDLVPLGCMTMSGTFANLLYVIARPWSFHITMPQHPHHSHAAHVM